MNRNVWFGLLALLVVLAVASRLIIRHGQPEPLRIGVLHSLGGTMAVDEAPLVDAIRLAVEEINAEGGLLGRPLEMRVADGQSDNRVFVREAERLLGREKVSVLFGCWTSACRKAVKPLVERHGKLMFYALQYEGLEESAAVFYAGSTANQQVIPAAHWAVQQFGRRVYLAGSDYAFPRLANQLIRDVLVSMQGTTVAGEHYRKLGDNDFSAMMAEIRNSRPDVIINTINGSSNAAFFRALHDNQLHNIPVLSFSINEVDLQHMGRDLYHPRHYAAWNYFQSLPGAENRRFIQAFRARFGSERMTNDPIEASYVAVRLWAQAVRDAGADDAQMVRRELLLQSIAAPSGIAAVDRNTLHLWKHLHIGKARPDFQFDIVWSASQALRPQTFPFYRSRQEWQALAASISEDKP